MSVPNGLSQLLTKDLFGGKKWINIPNSPILKTQRKTVGYQVEWDCIPAPPLPRAFAPSTTMAAPLIQASQVTLAAVAARPVQTAMPVQAVPANSVYALGSIPVSSNQTPVHNASSQEFIATNECYLSPSALLPAFDETHEPASEITLDEVEKFFFS